MNPTQKALIYCRVSSERQKNEGHGLDSQEHRCRLYCDQKRYEVEKVFRDSFSGGGDFMKRPAMAELLKYIDDHPHRSNYVVVFDDLSRLARDVEAHLKLRTAFHFRKVKLECLNFNLDESDEGRFGEIIVAASAELQRLQNRRQVIQKQRARLEGGYWPFYPPPGYRSTRDPTHGKLLHPYELEAAPIREALEGFASDRFHSQGDVWRFFQSFGKYPGKKKIAFQMVNRLFDRVMLYAGFIEYAPWEVARRQGHHQSLISLETYQRICDKLNGKVVIYTRKDMRADFPLRATNVVCGACGRSLTASYTRKKNGAVHPYYRCSNTACPEHTKSIRRDVIEPALEELLQGIRPKQSVLKVSEVIFMDLWEKRMVWLAEHERKIQSERESILKDIELLVGRIKKSESEHVRDVYEKQIEELSKREKELSAKNLVLNRKRGDFRTALQMVFDYLKNPYFRWKTGDLGEKRMVMQLVFEGVLPYDRETGFRTAPLSLPLRVFEHFVTSKSQGVDR